MWNEVIVGVLGFGGLSLHVFEFQLGDATKCVGRNTYCCFFISLSGVFI